MSDKSALTPEQTHALFDILTHHETYAEIVAFKYPEAVTGYGYPFKSVTRLAEPSPSPLPQASSRSSLATSASASGSPGSRSTLQSGDGKVKSTPGSDKGGSPDESGDEKKGSTSPILQTLLTRFVLHLPWLRDLPGVFWSVRLQGILARLAEADLSESYDKGTLGLRKTLATGASTLVEMVARGAFGGVKRAVPPGAEENPETAAYDHDQASELERAWNDSIQHLVYGDLAHGMFSHLAQTSDLEAYSPTAKAAAEYIIVHLAAFMHHTFVVSPEGQYLLQLLSNVHSLIPYKMIKQTLRIGNAATMINGMMKLLLAKLSVGSITNWVGLTSNADDGMNLLQRIISLVLAWDATEFRKSAERVEKDGSEESPDPKALLAIRRFVEEEDRTKRDTVRAASLAQSQSIVTSILMNADPELAVSLSEEQHAQCLEFYSSLLSVRDRNAITAVLCNQQPDLFTQTVRELVDAYEPFIRMIHNGVDLREYLEVAQGFVDEFIKASRPKAISESAKGATSTGNTTPPSVDDYVSLLTRNRHLLYRFIHAVASNCPDVWSDLEGWVTKTAAWFRVDDQSRGEEAGVTSRDMEARLDELFQSLPDSSQAAVREALDQHAVYLSKLTETSKSRFQTILDSTHNPGNGSISVVGPGVYLSRWQNLLDETPITPELPVGPVRSGREVKHTLARGKASIVGDKGQKLASPVEYHGPEPPDVSVVVKELGGGFVSILQETAGPDF